MIDPVYLLKKLVSIPSISDVGQCQEIVASVMQELGLQVDMFTPDGSSYKTVNVVGRLQGNGGGKSLMLIAHVDTVPVEPIELWEYPPFSGKVKGDRMYGRGVYDDKAGIVEMLLVVDKFNQQGLRLKGDLILASLADDESNGLSFSELAKRGYVADALLMLDGAKVGEVIYAHAGCIWYRIVVYGKPTACNNKSANAVEKTFKILNSLRQIADSMNSCILPPWNMYSSPIRLNICKISGGEWLGNNAAKCITEFSLNFASSDTVESLKNRIENIITKVSEQDEWLKEHPPIFEPVYMAFDPYIADLDTPFYNALNTCHIEETRKCLTPRVVTGWFHGGRLQQPCFLYGPGNGGNSHGVNEYFELSSFQIVTSVLVRLLKLWRGISEA